MKTTNIRLTYPGWILNALNTIASIPLWRDRSLDAYGLEGIYYRLMVKAMNTRKKSTALEFLPILEQVKRIDPTEWAFLQQEMEGRKVVVDNAYIKVVLIRWEPGQVSAIHHHPLGGGVIKVLEGAIEESRYWNADDTIAYAETRYRRLQHSYIDDSQGYHAVRNPYDEPAVTMHVYLKYR